MLFLKNELSFLTKQFRKLTFPSWLRLCIEFLSLSCHHSSVLNVFMPTQITEVELTAGPAPWPKTIKSKVEIGHSLVVMDNSRTNVRDCKFPLLTTPCPQIHRAKLWGCLTCLHTICYSCCGHRKVVVSNY